ncbi:MAG: FecR domain-containing protein [Chitinophagaceae bacterium]|nr:FecR domain-containing protein [Chitinophagaceae bacterium]
MDEQWQKAWDEPEEIDPTQKQELLGNIHRRIDAGRRRKRSFIIGISAAAAVLLVVIVRMPGLISRGHAREWQELASNDSSQRILLNDSSVLWLAPHSVVRVNPDLAHDRRVALVSGSAFFSVAKDERHVFTVAVNQQQVTVLGTAFTLHKMDSLDLQLTVKEGKVALSNSGGRQLLIAGEEVSTVRGKTGTVRTEDPDAADWWLQSRTRWHNIELEELLDRIEKYYHVKLTGDDMNRKIKLTLTWDLTIPLKDNLTVLNSLTGYNIHQ